MVRCDPTLEAPDFADLDVRDGVGPFSEVLEALLDDRASAVGVCGKSVSGFGLETRRLASERASIASLISCSRKVIFDL